MAVRAAARMTVVPWGEQLAPMGALSPSILSDSNGAGAYDYHMQLLWMPYVRFTLRKYQERNVQLGPVTLWPDADETWRQALGVARPRWLNIYRDFPRHGSSEIGEPSRGTVAVGTDGGWLARYHKRLVAVLYFLGDGACADGEPRAGHPGECFYGRMLSVEGEPHELVQIWTKHGPLVEDENALKVTPPLAVRGNREAYFLDLDRAEHRALVDLLFAKPEHRLITACLHYFLAQTGDPLVVSFEQDYANYCACLEGAFDIVQGAGGDDAPPPDAAAGAGAPVAGQGTVSAPSQPMGPPAGAGGESPGAAAPPVSPPSTPIGSQSTTTPGPTALAPAVSASPVGTEAVIAPVGPAAPQQQGNAVAADPPGGAPAPPGPLPKLFDLFVGALVAVYGESKELRDYARGLYTCRSIHDHGLSDFDPEETKKYRHQAYVWFLSKGGNYSICRAVCRDVMLRKLWEQPGGARTPLQRALAYRDAADGLLRKFFHSEKAWQAIKARVKEQGAGKKTGNLDGDGLEAFRAEAVAFLEGFDWQAVDGVEAKDAKEVLKTMLIANANSTGAVPAQPDAPQMEALGNAYDDKADPEKEISIWAMEHERHVFDVHSGDRTELIISVAWKAAKFFSRR